MALRILIVDDHTLVRQGLIALLQVQLPVAQIQEAADGLAAVRICSEWSPDVVLMDISMPRLGGLDAARKILEHHPKSRILMLTGHGGGQLAAEAIRAGARGLVAKDSAFEELITAIHSILAGNTYLSSRHAAPQVESADGKNVPRDDKHSLTLRERDVLELLAGGQAMKEIARNLAVSIKTVETHRRKIMEKLNIYSIAELTKYALKEGLTPLYGASLARAPSRAEGAAHDADEVLQS